MGIIKRMREARIEKRYGPIVSVYRFPESAGGDLVNSPHYHVSGPVEQCLLTRRFHVGDILDYDMLNDGRIHGEREEDYERLVQAYGKIREACLDGKFEISSPTPISSELFLLPVNADELNPIIESVEHLSDVEISRRLFLDYLGRSGFKRDFPKPVWDILSSKSIDSGNDNSQIALHYLRSLVLWKIEADDYSDYVNFIISERRNGAEYDQSFFIERNWSKATNERTGIYEPVLSGRESVIISGNIR